MSKSKVILITSGSVILLVMLLWLAVVGLPKQFSLKAQEVTKIEFLESSKIYRIDNKHDIQEFMAYFKNARLGYKSAPSCPFNLPVVFYQGNKKIPMVLGTDACGFVKYDGYYFNLKIPVKAVKHMQDIIRNTGLDFDKVKG